MLIVLPSWKTLLSRRFLRVKLLNAFLKRRLLKAKLLSSWLRRCLLTASGCYRAVPLIADRIVKSRELASYMFELGQSGYNSGRKDGYSEGRAAVVNNEKEYHF
ncbi:hypothetical protein HanHA300_Chr17g0673641 [Helianthus annuus]|nr:hypothetical protein HanHA300_Chr17g0673641 [Helianthus annuus]